MILSPFEERRMNIVETLECHANNSVFNQAGFDYIPVNTGQGKSHAVLLVHIEYNTLISDVFNDYQKLLAFKINSEDASNHRKAFRSLVMVPMGSLKVKGDFPHHIQHTIVTSNSVKYEITSNKFHSFLIVTHEQGLQDVLDLLEDETVQYRISGALAARRVFVLVRSKDEVKTAWHRGKVRSYDF